MKYTFLVVVQNGMISETRIESRKALSFEPSGALFQAFQLADYIFGCYPGADRIELYNLLSWNGAPTKALVRSWLQTYKFGHRQALESHIYGHWKFAKGVNP